MKTINKKYWLWYWGQTDVSRHSPKKKFTDFNKMKGYSARHSAKHKWIGRSYWSQYDKIEK